jgi:hypothetical protein
MRSRIGFVASFALAVTASACSHDQPVNSPKAGPSPEVVAASNDPLGFLPVDAQLVGGVDYAQVSASPLFKDLLAVAGGQGLAKLTEVTQKCGTPASFSFAFKGIDGETPTGTIVFHGVDHAKFFTSCVPEMQQHAAQGKHDHQITVDGGDVVLIKAPKMAGAGMFATDTTFVMVVGPVADRATLTAAVASGVPLRKSQAFAEMFGKVDTKRAAWGVANGDVLKALSGMGVQAQGVFGTLALDNGVSVDGRLRLASADQASSLAGMVKSQAGQAAAFVDKLDINNDGPDVTLSLSMSAEKLKAIIAMAGKGDGGGPQ